MNNPQTDVFSLELVRRLAEARSVAVLTGAGISAESGVPTFRDAGGLWERLRPEELANIEAFVRNPELVQAWYGHRRRLIHGVTPNPGHVALAELELLVDLFTLITQNVDGLHQRAGNEHVIELHGNLTRNYCIDCHRYAAEEALEGPELITCRSCGGLIRPDVVWFGELLPEGAFTRAEQAARRADVFLSVGTSSVVYPAADLPMIARTAGAYVAEINPTPTALSPFLDETVVGNAGTVLPRLIARVRELRNEKHRA